MVNPNDVKKYNRTEEELQEFLLFCVSVAGKTAKQISISLESFLGLGKEYIKSHYWNNDDYFKSLNLKYPFVLIKELEKINKLEEVIKNSKLGQHYKLKKCFSQLSSSKIDLTSCSIECLEKFYGIGPKTSRYFILYTRECDNIAVLDTHVLKFMREELNIKTPKSTPNKKAYKFFENEFIKYAKSINKKIADLDLEIWIKYSRK